MIYFKKLFLLSIMLVFIGSAETFSQVKSETITDTTKSDFSYNILEKSYSKVDKVSITNKEKLLTELERINFIYGDVYFSGTGFTEVIAMKITGSIASLSTYLDRCVSGSQITFDNCIIKNNDGSVIKDFQKGIFFY